ncbi:MAG: hypothetical protein LRY71_05380 [Bacillaceae bacterium]|nr:hypothetical protein [Bacillaceae bacterium]
MEKLNETQQKLIEFAVDKVLEKHGVGGNHKIDMSSEEKQKITDIVNNIKLEVETFLQNQVKTKTELDFASSEQEDVPVVPKHEMKKKLSKFISQNDLSTVKKFM